MTEKRCAFCDNRLEDDQDGFCGFICREAWWADGEDDS